MPNPSVQVAYLTSSDVMQVTRVASSYAAIDMSHRPVWTPIIELSNDLKFLYPVLVKVERSTEGFFFVECPTFNLFTTAESYEKALDSIKSLFIDDYQVLLESYPQSLTVSAKRMLILYRAFFGEELP